MPRVRHFVNQSSDLSDRSRKHFGIVSDQTHRPSAGELTNVSEHLNTFPFLGLFFSVDLIRYSSSDAPYGFILEFLPGVNPAEKNKRICIPQVEPSMGNGRENKQDAVTISAIFQQPQCQCMSKTIGSGNFADLPLASRFFADDPPMPTWAI